MTVWAGGETDIAARGMSDVAFRDTIAVSFGVVAV